VLIDRFGARTLLAVSLILTAGSQAATALTTTVAPLFLWQVIGGLAAGAQQAALFSAVTESVARSRLGRALGWLTLSMQVGFFPCSARRCWRSRARRSATCSRSRPL